MVKVKLEKAKKATKAVADAPKDRVKAVKNLVKVEKKEKPIKKPVQVKKPLVKKVVDDEAPVSLLNIYKFS